MKNLVFVGVVLLLIAGCDDHKNTHVINNSNYDVNFAFADYRGREYTLKPKTDDYYEETVYTIKRYSANPPRVSFHYSDKYEVTFTNTAPRQIKIINEIDRDVLITAQGCMDNEPIIIMANDEFIGGVYNSKPIFNGVTSDSFLINFTYSTDGLVVKAHW
jgi:hypothetical protein